MIREICLLDNQELVNPLMQIKKELHDDFSKYLLESCETCSKNIDQTSVTELHARLATIYTELSLIKELLSKKI